MLYSCKACLLSCQAKGNNFYFFYNLLISALNLETIYRYLLMGKQIQGGRQDQATFGASHFSLELQALVLRLGLNRKQITHTNEIGQLKNHISIKKQK